jgi:hypothetical protein
LEQDEVIEGDHVSQLAEYAHPENEWKRDEERRSRCLDRLREAERSIDQEEEDGRNKTLSSSREASPSLVP